MFNSDFLIVLNPPICTPPEWPRISLLSALYIVWQGLKTLIGFALRWDSDCPMARQYLGAPKPRPLARALPYWPHCLRALLTILSSWLYDRALLTILSLWLLDCVLNIPVYHNGRAP